MPDELLSTPVRTAERTTTLREAAVAMGRWHVGFLVVVEDGIVVGVVTDRDVALAVLADDEDPDTTTVDAIMAKSVVCLGQDEPLDDAARRMRDHGVRKLPVIDDVGRPVAVVTADDLLRRIGARAALVAAAVDRELSFEAAPFEADASGSGDGVT